MGGKAIPNARRMPRAEYDRITNLVCTALTNRFPELSVQRLLSYGDKPDFGNLSLVTQKVSPEQDTAVRDLLANSIATGHVVRQLGDRISVDVDGAQVDVTFVDEKNMKMFCAYHAYNGLGGLIGKVAHSMGLTLREDALVYRIVKGDQLVEELQLADRWSEALRILGFSAVRWKMGFGTLEDIFDFVASSAHFRAGLFHVTEPIVEGVRPTVVQLFSQWLQSAPLLAERDAILQMLFQRVPGFESNYHDVISRQARAQTRARAVRARFNGDLVAEWTGRTGRDLGALMKRIDESFGGRTAVEDWALDSSSDIIKQQVLKLHEQMQ